MIDWRKAYKSVIRPVQALEKRNTRF